jgi:release factor glutamine methyltransferase
MNIAEALRDAAFKLGDAGVAQRRMEAASLMTFALKCERSFLIAHPEYELEPFELDVFESVVGRRVNREPFQHIVGKQEFYGLDFEVSPEVLIPRPETEILVERAIHEFSKTPLPDFCEVGVGSGCISIAVLKNIPDATAVGVDISEAAIKVAQRNAEAHGVAERLTLKISDVYAALGDETFDAILSNPPYIPGSEMLALQPEVRDFEPHTALTDHGTGLSIIERLIAVAPRHLKKEGILIIEIGFGQAESIKLLFDENVWRSVEILNDLQQIPRTVIAVRA